MGLFLDYENTDLWARMLTDFTDFLFFDDAVYFFGRGLHWRSASPASHGFVQIPRITPLPLAYGCDVPVTANVWACFLSVRSCKHEAKPSVSVNPPPLRENTKIKNPCNPSPSETKWSVSDKSKNNPSPARSNFPRIGMDLFAHGFFSSDADGFHGFLIFWWWRLFLRKGITLPLGFACVSLYICTYSTFLTTPCVR